MTEVRIYQPARTAMQSGRANVRNWVLEYQPAAAKTMDPLMGWAGSVDTLDQVRMKFQTMEEAVAFAERNGLSFETQEPKQRRIRPRNYSDNFSFHRIL